MVIKINSQRGHSLLEVSRKDLVTKSRVQSKKRFDKRLNYQVSNFRGCDLQQLFENDIFVFTTPIKDYVCTIAFPGVFTSLKEVVRSTAGDPSKINLQMVIKALRLAFDRTDDVKVRCSCADFKYRFMYWASNNGYLYGPPDQGTEEFPEKTNPDDMLGATCKHLDLLLSNKRWLTKASSVINSFIKTYPDKAALYLYDTYSVPDSEVDDVEDDELELEPKSAETDRFDSDDDDTQEDEVDKDEEEGDLDG